jgi:hypothetical protein
MIGIIRVCFADPFFNLWHNVLFNAMIVVRIVVVMVPVPFPCLRLLLLFFFIGGHRPALGGRMVSGRFHGLALFACGLGRWFGSNGGF